MPPHSREENMMKPSGSMPCLLDTSTGSGRVRSIDEMPMGAFKGGQPVPGLLDTPAGGGRFRTKKEKPAVAASFLKSMEETNARGRNQFWGRRHSQPDLMETPKKLQLDAAFVNKVNVKDDNGQRRHSNPELKSLRFGQAPMKAPETGRRNSVFGRHAKEEETTHHQQRPVVDFSKQSMRAMANRASQINLDNVHQTRQTRAKNAALEAKAQRERAEKETKRQQEEQKRKDYEARKSARAKASAPSTLPSWPPKAATQPPPATTKAPMPPRTPDTTNMGYESDDDDSLYEEVTVLDDEESGDEYDEITVLSDMNYDEVTVCSDGGVPQGQLFQLEGTELVTATNGQQQQESKPKGRKKKGVPQLFGQGLLKRRKPRKNPKPPLTGNARMEALARKLRLRGGAKPGDTQEPADDDVASEYEEFTIMDEEEEVDEITFYDEETVYSQQTQELERAPALKESVAAPSPALQVNVAKPILLQPVPESPPPEKQQNPQQQVTNPDVPGLLDNTSGGSRFRPNGRTRVGSFQIKSQPQEQQPRASIVQKRIQETANRLHEFLDKPTTAKEPTAPKAKEPSNVGTKAKAQGQVKAEPAEEKKTAEVPGLLDVPTGGSRFRPNGRARVGSFQIKSSEPKGEEKGVPEAVGQNKTKPSLIQKRIQETMDSFRHKPADKPEANKPKPAELKQSKPKVVAQEQQVVQAAEQQKTVAKVPGLLDASTGGSLCSPNGRRRVGSFQVQSEPKLDDNRVSEPVGQKKASMIQKRIQEKMESFRHKPADKPEVTKQQISQLAESNPGVAKEQPVIKTAVQKNIARVPGPLGQNKASMIQQRIQETMGSFRHKPAVKATAKEQHGPKQLEPNQRRPEAVAKEQKGPAPVEQNKAAEVPGLLDAPTGGSRFRPNGRRRVGSFQVGQDAKVEDKPNEYASVEQNKASTFQKRIEETMGKLHDFMEKPKSTEDQAPKTTQQSKGPKWQKRVAQPSSSAPDATSQQKPEAKQGPFSKFMAKNTAKDCPSGPTTQAKSKPFQKFVEETMGAFHELRESSKGKEQQPTKQNKERDASDATWAHAAPPSRPSAKAAFLNSTEQPMRRRQSAPELRSPPSKLHLPQTQSSQVPPMFAANMKYFGEFSKKGRVDRRSSVPASLGSQKAEVSDEKAVAEAIANARRFSVLASYDTPTKHEAPAPQKPTEVVAPVRSKPEPKTESHRLSFASFLKPQPQKAEPEAADTGTTDGGRRPSKLQLPRMQSMKVPPLFSESMKFGLGPDHSDTTNTEEKTERRASKLQFPRMQSMQVPPLFSESMKFGLGGNTFAKKTPSGLASSSEAKTGFAEEKPADLPPPRRVSFAPRLLETRKYFESNKSIDSGDVGMSRLDAPTNSRIDARRQTMPAFNKNALQKALGDTTPNKRRQSEPVVKANPQVPDLLDTPDGCVRFRRQQDRRPSAGLMQFQKTLEESGSVRRPSMSDWLSPKKLQLPRMKNTQPPPGFSESMTFFEEATTVGIPRFS